MLGLKKKLGLSFIFLNRVYVYNYINSDCSDVDLFDVFKVPDDFNDINDDGIVENPEGIYEDELSLIEITFIGGKDIYILNTLMRWQNMSIEKMLLSDDISHIANEAHSIFIENYSINYENNPLDSKEG